MRQCPGVRPYPARVLAVYSVSLCNTYFVDGVAVLRHCMNPLPPLRTSFRKLSSSFLPYLVHSVPCLRCSSSSNGSNEDIAHVLCLPPPPVFDMWPHWANVAHKITSCLYVYTELLARRSCAIIACSIRHIGRLQALVCGCWTWTQTTAADACVSSRDSMVVMDDGASSGADTVVCRP
jgi:hypothetical protein